MGGSWMLVTNYQQYKGVLFVFGHGEGDPGCVYQKETEAEMIRRLKPHLIKWGKTLAVPVTCYPRNLYYHANDLKEYQDWIVVELHLDAARIPGKGGHVIIHQWFKPDAIDKNLITVIDQHFSLVTRTSKGLSCRKDLKNCNIAAQYGINYRLVELFFLADKQDRMYYLNHLDDIAKTIVQAISGQKDCRCVD